MGVNNKVISVENLYEGYFQALYPIGYAHLKRRDETEEIIQHLFLKIAKGKIDLDSIDRPAIFLERAVRNAAINKLKKMGVSTFKDPDVVLAEEAKILHNQSIQIPNIKAAVTRFRQRQEVVIKSEKKTTIFVLLSLLILLAILVMLLM